MYTTIFGFLFITMTTNLKTNIKMYIFTNWFWFLCQGSDTIYHWFGMVECGTIQICSL